jgi:hypothetical protein
MLYSKIIHEDTLYILLHAEQVYQNFNVFNNKLGFFTSELTDDTVRRVFCEINTINDIKTIVIDFFLLEENRQSVKSLSNIVNYCIEKSIKLSFIRMNESLYGSPENPVNKFININLKFRQLQEIKIKIDNKNYFNLSLDFNDSYTVSDCFDDYILELYSNTILYNRILIKYKENNPKLYSESSNVELPIYINVKKFIEEKEISFLGLYLLCKKAIKDGLIPNFNSQSKPIVFFQSIIGSYLASIFAKIACLDIRYLDHIGPRNKIYRTMRKDIFKNPSDYLLISDVICMGTEIQIAKSIIAHEGSKVNGILSIIDVKVIDKLKNDKAPQLCSLFTLTKENNNEIDYQIKTNF